MFLRLSSPHWPLQEFATRIAPNETAEITSGSESASRELSVKFWRVGLGQCIASWHVTLLEEAKVVTDEMTIWELTLHGKRLATTQRVYAYLKYFNLAFKNDLVHVLSDVSKGLNCACANLYWALNKKHDGVTIDVPVYKCTHMSARIHQLYSQKCNSISLLSALKSRQLEFRFRFCFSVVDN